MSPSPEDCNNRIRVIDSDVAALLSPLSHAQIYNYCTHETDFNGTIHVHTDTRAGTPFRCRTRGSTRTRTPAPFYSTGVQVCLVLQRLDSSLLWPYSIRSLRQPLSSSRSITSPEESLRLALIDQVGKARHERGSQLPRMGCSSRGKALQDDREFPGPHFWCHGDI